MLKAVIFDMDGVLIDSEPMHARVAMMVLKEYGITVTNDYICTFIGTTNRKMFETMIDDFHIDATVEDLLTLDAKILKKVHEEEGYPAIEGTKELIIDLYNNGIKLAIASSSSAAMIEEVTNALGIRKYFTKLVSGANIKHPKPAPDVFLMAAKELGVDPSECMIIEDSMHGVVAAKAAGMKSIGFINKNSGNQDLSKAFVLIESFKDVDYTFILKEYKRAYGQPITIATTDRLIIRELSVDNIKDLLKIYQQKEVNLYMNDLYPFQKESFNENDILKEKDPSTINPSLLEEEMNKHKAYIEHVYGFYGFGLWGVFLKEDHSLIGRCGIECNVIDGETVIELSYLLDYHHWGFGYALESVKAVVNFAFDELEIDKIVCVIDKNNLRSIKVAEQIGMQIEKEIIHQNRDCYFYVIRSNQKNYNKIEHCARKEKYQNATKDVVDKFNLNPDTSVYSKRYHYKFQK